jgi:hypothetical protein
MGAHTIGSGLRRASSLISAHGWYARYAVPLADAPLSRLLPLATIEAALKAAGKYR